VRPEQIEYLSALDHLSRTAVYGVTFERGTSVAYRDRKHVILSGTASIDSKGEIVHPGDVAQQLDRTLENMEALLERAGARLGDMCHFIVYVRDPADQAEAERRMRERVGDAPVVVVVAPVCRPGWLIEVEGMAIVEAAEEELPEF
jgi:enamine deaminase RidA (YjgF/YER057c/UK114 family)